MSYTYVYIVTLICMPVHEYDSLINEVMAILLCANGK